MYLKTVNKVSNLKEDLLRLSQDDIKNMVDGSIFSRGKSYYKNDNVFDVKQNEENIVRARVKGSYANSYEIKLYKESDKLKAKCDCPYGDVCKHIVALLITINQSKEIKESIVLRQEDKLVSYFEKLSKVELIELLLEFASENLKKEIILQDAPIEELNIRINEIASSIQFDINDEDLLYSPEEFQERVSEYMENLKIFVNQNSDEVFEIVFDLATEIEDKQECGYLWIDHYDYRGEEYFDFDIFSEEIMALIHKIKDKEKQLKTFIEFGALANSSDYLPFSYESLAIEDRRDFLQYFDKNSSLGFYNFIEDLLSFEEKEHFLLAHDIDNVYEKLVSLYLENDKRELAINIVESLLKEKFDLQYVQKLLSLKEISAERFRGFVHDAIEHDSYRGFDFIVEGLKRIENTDDLEALWREKNPSQYYQFLEKENRISEMYEMLKILPQNREKFLKKNKEAYRDEAIEFFNAQIEENVRGTGDSYYRAIADALSELKPLIEIESFRLKIEKLKSDYKRRRNFLAILNQRFR